MAFTFDDFITVVTGLDKLFWKFHKLHCENTLYTTISDKYYWDSLYFHKKSRKKAFDSLKDTKNSLFPLDSRLF